MIQLLKTLLLLLFVSVCIGCGGNKTNKNKLEAQSDKEEVSKNMQDKNSEHKDRENVPIAEPEINIDQILEAALNGNKASVEEALENGFDVNSTDGEMHTALMLASYNGHKEIVKLLLDKGADPNARDRMDRTALMYSSTGAFNETVLLLLKAGASPNLVDNEEHFTALMFAAAEGQAEVVVTLLEHGADKTLLDIDNESAYDFALNNGHMEVAQLLK